MKNFRHYLAIAAVLFLITGCDEYELIPGAELSDQLFQQDALKRANTDHNKVTGFVEVVWKGADKGGDMGNKPEGLRTFMDISAHAASTKKGPRGELVFTVLEPDQSLHREIRAEVVGVKIYIDIVNGEPKEKAKVLAVVYSDTKGCSGNGGSGHDESCGGSGMDPEGHDGGCSHDETDGGGCSHDDGAAGESTHDEAEGGGCSHDDSAVGGSTHDEGVEGGCSHDDGVEGGCSDSGGSSDTHGGSPGGADKGNPTKGKNCRVGQILALKTHDGGSPGRGNDGIHWKWIDPESSNFLFSYEESSWKGLCKKEIIEGNVTVHVY